MKVNYRRSQDILEVIVRDASGRKLCHYKANIGDKKQIKMIFATIQAKHDIPIPTQKEIFDF